MLGMKMMRSLEMPQQDLSVSLASGSHINECEDRTVRSKILLGWMVTQSNFRRILDTQKMAQRCHSCRPAYTAEHQLLALTLACRSCTNI